MVRVENRLHDSIDRLLSGAPQGLTVERIRSLLQVGGSTARKDEIVRALRELSARGSTHFGRDRKWHRRASAATRGVEADSREDQRQAGLFISGDRLLALPARAMPGEPATPDDAPPAGRLATDRRLLGKLLPYYQEALRAGSGGAPVESLPRHGRSFVLLQPDSVWWPGERQSQTLAISRSRLSEGMLEALAKNSGRSLILGYPCLLVSPRDTDSAPFLRPVATLRCRFRLTDTALELRVPAIRPTLNPDWLTEQKRHGGWDVGRLRSWLLLEDESNPAPEEEDIDTAAFVDFPALAGRLDAAVARSIRTRLDPACIDASVPAAPETGIYNAVALINDGGSKFTRSAIADYDRLTGLNEGAAADTALAALFDQSPPSLGGIPVLHPFAMSESQLVAAKAGLTGPLTVVTGPPGTGKSQMIAAVMLSAAAGGRSALLAARQHRALDAVQERLQDLAGDRAVLVRASEEGGGAGFGFHQAIQALLTRPDAPDAPSRFRERYRAVAAADAERWRHLDGWRELARSSNAAAGARQALQDAEAELDRALGEASGKGIASPPERVERGLLRRLMAPLLRLFRPRPPAIGSAWRVREARCRIDRLRSDLAKAEREADALREKLAGTDDDPVALTERLTAETEDLVPLLLESLDSVDHATRQALTEIGGEAALQGRGSRVALTEDGARLILRHLPLWAVTTLAAGSRIPLQAGLFDYVIFDEAAQTDIASALPLLFRAKAAVVVGDPQQLAMISNLDPREECDLLRRFDLFHPGIGRFSQGRTSLFDLAAGSSAARRFLLTDHFRCHPQIAGYINEAFYGRRLAALTDVSRLRVPSGYRPGLHWTDVTGPIEARSGAGQSGSAASTAEAAAVADEVARLTGQRFEGSIGVVAFFDYQAKKIQDLLRTRLSPEDFNRHQIKVFTANKFQGDERDVMLFSLCLGPDMPSGARYFIQQEKRLLNVAVSRARAVCHIFGDLSHAADCGIPHVETLVRQVRRARDREAGPAGDRFESPWEARLYDALVAAGLAPMPQYPVGGRFLDLALIDDSRDPPIRLDIEVDGAFYHQDEFGDRIPTDLWRDHQLRALGWKVLRFWVRELRDEMERCVGRVLTEYRA